MLVFRGVNFKFETAEKIPERHARKTWGKKNKTNIGTIWKEVQHVGLIVHLRKKKKHACLESPTPPNTNLFPLPSPEKNFRGPFFREKVSHFVKKLSNLPKKITSEVEDKKFLFKKMAKPTNHILTTG